ncbi:MAG TPA: patatin-like phospholipase family protein [Thermoanaerobaculia bacterium]|nr:patatin-like phospholipase family protein [Thermoanaerobaculia bacterium]
MTTTLLEPETASRTEAQGSGPGELALVLGGGGARAAYQVGLLRCLGRHFPNLEAPIITGVSAGAINAVHFAARRDTFAVATRELADLWASLRVEDVFSVRSSSLGMNLMRWGLRLVSGGSSASPPVRGMVDTTPLRRFLRKLYANADGEIIGIRRNIDEGRVRAIAVTTLNYTTGQTVTWIQGRAIETWERPNRRSVRTEITPSHVMASASLPLFFPAVRIGNHWYGDGGIRHAAPLSPALHLGARRIIAISTRYNRTFEEADQPVIYGYPPPAQILGQLMNAIFLDVLDQDAARLERINMLVERIPPEERMGFQPVEFVVIRPSRDIGAMAGDYEPRLPPAFRFLTRGLGTKETRSADMLSLLLFQPDYLKALIDLGEEDGEKRLPELRKLLRPEQESSASI